MSVSTFAVRLFGRFTRGKKYGSLQESLRKARMPVSADAHVATCMLYSVLMIIPSFLLGYFVAWLLDLGFLFTLLLIFLFSAMFSFLAYYIGKAYPAMTASDKAYKIDTALPYTASFMYALSRSGATIVDIFRELSIRTDVGALAPEARTFMRDVEYLGQDPLTALRNLAQTTPSMRFKTFLEVMISIIETGGDTTAYFATRCSEYQVQMKEDQKKTINLLEFIAEFYIIVVVFSSLLFLTIIVLLGMMPGEAMSTVALYAIAYIWIPLGSIAFVVLISSTARGRPSRKLIRFARPEAFRGVEVVRGDERDRAMLRRMLRSAAGTRLKNALKNPLKTIRDNPEYMFFISIPIAIVYLMTNPLGGMRWYVLSEPISTILITALIAVMPYVVVFEFRSRWAEKTENALPDFLKSLSSAVKSGLTLPRAIGVTATSNLGPLTDEVRRMNQSLKWGTSSVEAIEEFERRMAASPEVSRSATLIRKAGEAEADISDVLGILSNDVEALRSMKKERSMAMFIYKIIIVLTFGVSLITSYFVVTSFVSIQPAGGGALGAIGFGGGGGTQFQDTKTIFFHATLLQGLFAGLLAAQMGENDLRAGIKYAVLMLLLTYIVFAGWVMPAQPTVLKPEEAAILPALF